MDKFGHLGPPHRRGSQGAESLRERAQRLSRRTERGRPRERGCRDLERRQPRRVDAEDAENICRSSSGRSPSSENRSSRSRRSAMPAASPSRPARMAARTCTSSAPMTSPDRTLRGASARRARVSASSPDSTSHIAGGPTRRKGCSRVIVTACGDVGEVPHFVGRDPREQRHALQRQDLLDRREAVRASSAKVGSHRAGLGRGHARAASPTAWRTGRSRGRCCRRAASAARFGASPA